jgi:hypothetical protein
MQENAPFYLRFALSSSLPLSLSVSLLFVEGRRNKKRGKGRKERD